MPADKEKGPLSGNEQRAELNKEPELLKDGGGEGAGLPRFEQLSLFSEDEPAAPTARPVSDDTWEVTTVKAGCAHPQRAVRSASDCAPKESLLAEEVQAGARGQKKVIRQKLSREERKKAREKFLRWAEAINAMLEEHLQRTGKTREEILFEILGSAPPAPPPGRRPGKRSRRKNAGLQQAAAPPRDAVLQKGGAFPKSVVSRKKKDVAGPKRGLEKSLEKEPEKEPESVPEGAPQSAPETLRKVAFPARETRCPQEESLEERPPVKVTFFPEEDAAVLNLAESGAVSPAADLYLHRQALGLLLSPGFDTLLSVQAARDIQLLDYQLATVRHVLKHLRGRALLCDEVGLGKTIEAGLIMMEYLLRGLVRRVLVLTPPSLVEQWRQEMQAKFNLDFITYDAPLFKSTPRPWTVFPYIIASLDTSKREPHRSMVLEPAYDLVIVDEAHHLKNKTTQAYQLVSQLKKKYVLFLTATPVENDLEELFNLITLLQPGQLETASSFKRKYITRGDPLKPKNTEELKRLVREVMVRNRRSETGVITARRHAEVVEVTLSPEEAAFYRRLTSFVRGHYTPEAAKLSGGVNQFILKTLQREVGSSIEAVLPTLEKMAASEENPPSLRRLLKTLADQAGEVPRRAKAEALVRLLKKIPAKAVVFTCFRETLHFLAALLEREGFSVARLHGGMRRAEKEAQVQAFAGGARVLVSTETGSEGRNLQFCNVLVNYDLPWNPMRIEQRIGRLHRLGQTKDVYIYNLSAAGTVEAYILDLLDAKINMFQLVVGELDMILGNLREKKNFEDIVMDIWAGAADEAALQAGLAELGEKLAAAKKHYLAVKELDDRLLGELLPEKD